MGEKEGLQASVGVDARSLGEYYRQEKTRFPGRLFRRLRHQQANAAQLLISENHLLTLAVVFDVTQTRCLRVTAQVRVWKSQKYGGAVFVNAILNSSVHAKAQTSWGNIEQARIQTRHLAKSLIFIGKAELRSSAM
jgi:hypothetical protein